MTDLDLGTWGRRLAADATTVVRLYLPGAPIDARRRELVAAVVATACRADVLADVHVAWLDLLGPAELDDVDDEVFRWVAAVVDSAPGAELPPPPEGLDGSVRGALVATVAHGVVSAVAVRRAQSAASRLLGRLPFSPRALAGDVVAAALAAPALIPVVAGAGVVSVVGRIVPDAAEMEVDPDPNLLAQLLADSMPAWIGGAWARVLVALLPVEVPMSWRSGATGATVRVGRGRVQVENGLAEDAWALFDGDVDNLVRAGSHRIARELREVHAER